MYADWSPCWRNRFDWSFGPKGQCSSQPWATPRENGDTTFPALKGQRSGEPVQRF